MKTEDGLSINRESWFLGITLSCRLMHGYKEIPRAVHNQIENKIHIEMKEEPTATCPQIIVGMLASKKTCLEMYKVTYQISKVYGF